MILLAELNKKVLRFSTNMDNFHLPFPNEQRVQKPLQELYSLLIDSYLFIIKFLKKRDVSESISACKPEFKSTY